MLKMKYSLAAALIALVALSANSFAFAGKKKQARFTVRIENVSDKDGLTAADGSRYPFALSPGVFAASEAKLLELFSVGKKATRAIEAQAEDGDPSMLAEFIVGKRIAGTYGVFEKPVGGDMPSPILPGGSYEFSFDAREGMKLNLITMFGQSNDLFYAPAKAISLFDSNGNPITGDITAEFLLWDAGTEVNEAPGIGADQGPRQKMKNTGAAEAGVVALVKDEFAYPNVKDVIRVTISLNDMSGRVTKPAKGQPKSQAGN